MAQMPPSPSLGPNQTRSGSSPSLVSACVSVFSQLLSSNDQCLTSNAATTDPRGNVSYD